MGAMISSMLLWLYTICNNHHIVLFFLRSWLLLCAGSIHRLLYFCYYFYAFRNFICLYYRILLVMLRMVVLLYNFHVFFTLFHSSCFLSVFVFFGVIPWHWSVSCYSFMKLGWGIWCLPGLQLFSNISIAGLTLCLGWPYDVVWLSQHSVSFMRTLSYQGFGCFIQLLYLIFHFSESWLLI